MMRFCSRSVHGVARGAAVVLLLLQLSVPAARAAEPPVEKAAPSQITVLNIALFYAGLIGAVIGASTGWVTWLIMPRMEPPGNAPSQQQPSVVPTP